MVRVLRIELGFLDQYLCQFGYSRIWSYGWDSNPRHLAYKASPLPLWYRSKNAVIGISSSPHRRLSKRPSPIRLAQHHYAPFAQLSETLVRWLMPRVVPLSVLSGLRKIQSRGYSGSNLFGAANGIRTHTTQILSLLPLPIGLPRHIRITAIYYINIISNFFIIFKFPISYR